MRRRLDESEGNSRTEAFPFGNPSPSFSGRSKDGMHVILMGAQGAGKGTQADRIAPRFNLAHVSTGELFRSEIGRGTEMGARVKGYLDRGELVPDSVTIGVVTTRIAEIADAGIQVGALLDGFPRTQVQATGLNEALAAGGSEITVVVEIHVPRNMLVRRLAGRWICPNCGATYHDAFHPPKLSGVCDRCGSPLIQRADDTKEAIERRLDTYFRETEPLLSFYAAQGLLKRIDGDQGIDEVTEQISAAIIAGAPDV